MKSEFQASSTVNTYGGSRSTLIARISSARCALNIDVSFGPTVTQGAQGAQTVDYRTLLVGLQHTLGVHPVPTVIAEKIQPMVMLNQTNTRMKDFFDFAVIAQRTELNGATLASAINATSERRHTGLPTERALAPTSRFSEDASQRHQWQAFRQKNRIEADSLGDTIALLGDMPWPPTPPAHAKSEAAATWRPNSVR